MSALGYGAAVGEAAIAALAARMTSVETTMPKPSSAAPPMIADTNAEGTQVRYAREDHTHKGNVDAKRIQVTGSDGTAVWTFGTPFTAAPVVIATAETPGSAAFINVASVMENSVTTTSATIVVNRVVKSLTLPTLATALLGLVLSLFGAAPVGVYVNCSARKAS